jgi:hypothetical protein
MCFGLPFAKISPERLNSTALLKHERGFYHLIAVARVKAMRVEACAARGDTDSFCTMLPPPELRTAAEFAADPPSAHCFFHYESTDQSQRRRLEMILHCDLDPPHDFAVEAGHESCLLRRVGRLNPVENLLRSARIAELLSKRTDCRRVAWFDLSHGYSVG